MSKPEYVGDPNLTVEYLEDMPFIRQIGLFRSAKQIVFVTGTAGANIAFCSPGTEVLEILTPPEWAKPGLYAEMASAINLPYIGLQGEYRTKLIPERHYDPAFGQHHAPVWVDTGAAVDCLKQLSNVGPEIV